jgi:hypothetical protein
MRVTRKENFLLQCASRSFSLRLASTHADVRACPGSSDSHVRKNHLPAEEMRDTGSPAYLVPVMAILRMESCSVLSSFGGRVNERGFSEAFAFVQGPRAYRGILTLQIVHNVDNLLG